MAWRRLSDKALSEPLMVRLLLHKCVTWPKWVMNPHNRHPIAQPWGWDMGCFLWVQALIHVLLQSMEWYIQYPIIYNKLDHVQLITLSRHLSVSHNIGKCRIEYRPQTHKGHSIAHPHSSPSLVSYRASFMKILVCVIRRFNCFGGNWI